MTYPGKTAIALGLKAIALCMVLLFIGNSPANATTAMVKCGERNQKACPVIKPGPICNSGLGSFNGICKPCGGANQRSCPPMERGAQCRGKTVKSGNYCRPCGGKDQLACPVTMKGPICNPGLGKLGDKCRPCGGANQTACPALEQGKQCRGDTTKVGDTCRPCGGNGEMACPVLKAGTVCKAGLGTFNDICRPCGANGQPACPAIEVGAQCRGDTVKVDGTCRTCGPREAYPCKGGMKDIVFGRYNNNKDYYDRRHSEAIAAFTRSGTNSNTVDINPDDVIPPATDEEKIDAMMERLDDPEVTTVTLVTGAAGAIGLGYSQAQGYAMMRRFELPEDGDLPPGLLTGSRDPQMYICRFIKTKAFTAGLSLTGVGFAEWGEWDGDFDAVAGETNGIGWGVGAFGAGWGGGAHWSNADGGADGVTVLHSAGAGADASVEYVHAWTEFPDDDDEVDCGTLEFY